MYVCLFCDFVEMKVPPEIPRLCLQVPSLGVTVQPSRTFWSETLLGLPRRSLWYGKNRYVGVWGAGRGDLYCLAQTLTVAYYVEASFSGC